MKFLSRKAKRISPYTAGEQPGIKNIIKLNTNENPYPPSKAVLDAIKNAADGRLRLYPRPDGGALKKAAAEYNGLEPENIFCGNGSDEILALSYLAFFDPDKKIAIPDISYSFYPVWAELFDIPVKEIRLNDDFTLPVDDFFNAEGGVVFSNPNAPTGIALPLQQVEMIVKNNPDTVVIVDEAYVVFGAESAIGLVNQYENLLVVRTFSKSHSLAGLRAAYAAGHPDLIGGLNRIKDSFNSYPLDMLAQAGAAAALADHHYYDTVIQKVIWTRETTAENFSRIGFRVLPSKTNFLFVSHPEKDAGYLLDVLRSEGIVVRHFNSERIKNYLRISIGTEPEMQKMIRILTNAL